MPSDPILPGCYPDPTICRVGDDYYLAASSFEYFPGVPLWHSRDLVSWTQIGHILTRRSQFTRGEARPSSGIYAGTLRHHDGRFIYITTNASDYDAGQLIVHAEDPAGEWSDPVHVPRAIGIDPDLAWDAGGQCFLTWKAMRFDEVETGILQAKIQLATGELLDTPYPVWQGSGLDAVEAPHLYEIDGWWYLVLAEGGTERGHTATIARGQSPAGPFEACPHNPILTSRSTISPVQNTGHADLVQTADGAWAAVYLGVRPHGSTPGFHVLGRETFLTGIDWIDGWPSLDQDRYPTPAIDTGFVDHFETAGLDQRWIVPGSEPASTTAPSTGGGLTILPAGAASAGLICTRVRDLRWRADVQLYSSGRFELRMDDRHIYGLVRGQATVQAVVRIGALQSTLAELSVLSGPVTLRIEAVDATDRPVPLGHAGPDEILLSLIDGERRLELARVDGRYLSTEVASGFTGRMLAVVATSQPALVQAVSYTPVPASTDPGPLRPDARTDASQEAFHLVRS